ncbi:MAG: helix-turn-helix domain-containing protein [Elusimicrobiota bacterium]
MAKKKRSDGSGVVGSAGGCYTSSMALEREFYTVKELAVVLEVNPRTIARLEARGELKSYKIGRAKRYRREDIEAYLQRCKG